MLGLCPATVSASIPLVVFFRYLLGDPVAQELRRPLSILVILILDLLPDSDLLDETLNLAQSVLPARVVKQLRVLSLFYYVRFRRVLQLYWPLGQRMSLIHYQWELRGAIRLVNDRWSPPQYLGFCKYVLDCATLGWTREYGHALPFLHRCQVVRHVILIGALSQL